MFLHTRAPLADRMRAAAEMLLAISFCVILAFSMAFTLEMRLIYKLAVLGGMMGIAGLFILPNPRISLVCTWVLIHPLSLEKVFIAGDPVLPDFFPPALVFSASDIILVLLACVVLMEKFIERDLSIRSERIMTPFAFMILWGTVTWGINRPDITSTLSLIHLMKMGIFLMIMGNAVRTEKEFHLLLATVMLAVIVQVGFVSASYLSRENVSLSSKVTSALMTFSRESGHAQIRATGTVGHVNQEASFLSFFMLSAAGLAASRLPVLKWAARMGIVGGLAAIILTFSRSAWLSVFMGIVFSLLFGIRHRQVNFRHWRYATPVMIAVLLSMPLYSGKMMDRLFHGDEGATDSRARAMSLAIDLARTAPIVGVGQGNFTRASLSLYPVTRRPSLWLESGMRDNELSGRYGRVEVSQVYIGERLYAVPLPVHNKYLLFLVETGGIGLFLFIWFQWRICATITRTFHGADQGRRWILMGLFAAFWASQIYMNLDLFADDKTMQILLFIPVLAMTAGRVLAPPAEGKA